MFFAGCSDDDDGPSVDPAIVGTWFDECGEYGYTFQSDGTFILLLDGQSYKGKFSTSNGKITITGDGGSGTMSYSINGDILNIEEHDTLHRKKSGNNNPTGIDPDILGTWINEDDSELTFNDNGTWSIVFDDGEVQSGTFSTSCGKVTITSTSDETPQTVSYSIIGDKLILTYYYGDEEFPFTYTRKNN